MKLGVFTLVHQRPWILQDIVRQAMAIDPEAQVHFTVDRPTAAVLREVGQCEERWPSNVRAFAAPFPAVAEREYFMELRNWQLDQLRPYKPEYCVLWDDDHLLEYIDEARHILSHRRPDLVYANKAYFWDDLEHVNIDLPLHHSVFFFKMLEGDRFPVDRFIHAPATVHDLPGAKVVNLKGHLLDVGYLLSHERERVFNVYKRAGKIDQLTTKLVDPAPKLETWKRKSPAIETLRDRMRQYVGTK